MTTLTMRRIRGDFVVTAPDIGPMRFKSRAEARDWGKTHYPGSPLTEIGRDASRRVIAAAKGRPRKVEYADFPLPVLHGRASLVVV